MSSENIPGELGYNEAIANILNQYSETIDSRIDLVGSALHENTHKVNYAQPFHLLKQAVTDVFVGKVDEEWRAENIATAILYSTENWNEVRPSLEDTEVSNDLIDSLLELHLRYEAEIEHSRMKGTHRLEHWSTFNWDLVRRDSGAIGTDNYLELYSGDVLEFSSSPSSSVAMAKFFLSQTTDLINEFGDEAITQISQEGIDELAENVRELADLIDSSEFESEQLSLNSWSTENDSEGMDEPTEEETE